MWSLSVIVVIEVMGVPCFDYNLVLDITSGIRRKKPSQKIPKNIEGPNKFSVVVAIDVMGVPCFDYNFVIQKNISKKIEGSKKFEN